MTDVFFASIVIPRSRSRSPESMTRSVTCLIFVVFAALLQHFVHKRGLTVIDVCDYRNVAQICSYQKYLSVSFLYFCLF